MARPIKNFCDYFTHDRDMRNHKKIKAVRTKFGLAGYAIWNMILETLTGSDGNVLEYSDMEFELLSGDYGVSGAEIRSVVDYCVSLEMLFVKDGFFHSESLDERLAPVYEKRQIQKSKSSKQRRANGKFVSDNTDETVVTVAETPYSKVKYSKVDNTNTITPSKEGGEKAAPIVGIKKAPIKKNSEPKKKVPPKKKGKNPDAEPYWGLIRKKWIWFNKTHLKFNVEPIPDRDYSHIHRIIEKLRERATGQAVLWTEENALKRWEKFLTVAYTEDDWLHNNFLAGNLESKMQKIFNLIDNPNGQHQKTGRQGSAASSVGKTITFDRP